MSNTFCIQLLAALVAQVSCMQFHTRGADNADSVAPPQVADVGVDRPHQERVRVGPQKLLGFEGQDTDVDWDWDWDEDVPIGTAICQHLHGEDAQLPYRFTLETKENNYTCLEQTPLFEVPSSMFEWDCAHKCLETPECKYIVVFHDLNICQGFQTCHKTLAHDDTASISIYRRRVDLDPARRKAAFLEGFSTKARQRMLLYFDFNNPISQDDSRRLSIGQNTSQRTAQTTPRPIGKLATNPASLWRRVSEVCDLSQRACEAAALQLNLELGGQGFRFAGQYSEVGCYAYSSGIFAGLAFYGYTDDGGEVTSQDQLTNIIVPSKYRLDTCQDATTSTTAPDGDAPQASASDQASDQGVESSTRRRVSRRRSTITDSKGRAVGTLWNAGEGDDRVPPAFGDNGKFGGFWSFKGTKTGIRVPQTADLLDYSTGPGATLVVVYRKDGYDSNMGRIFSGPNVDLYGFTKGMAINMNNVRCLYTDPTLYDGEFHFIFVSVTFATGHVEVYRDDVHIGNGTHGELFEEFDFLKTAFPWLIGVRYEYDTERPYDGDADEFAIFSWRFSAKDRAKYMECGGACFDNCTDVDQALKLNFSTDTTFVEFQDMCNETCQECHRQAVTRVASRRSQVEAEYISVTFLQGSPPRTLLFMEAFISLQPCTLGETEPRMLPLSDIVAEIREEIVRSNCSDNFTLNVPDVPAYCEVANPPPNCLGIVDNNPNRTYFMDPYIHPRVLFTPEDLPSIRSRLAVSWVAQEARNTLESMVELFDASSRYGQMYQKLLTCDPDYFDKLMTVEDLLVNQRNNTEWIAYPDMYTMFMYSGLLALIDQDNERGADLGAALACHSSFMELRYVPEDNNILNEDCEPALGLAYDYLFNFMTEEQHEPVRRLISTYTMGRVPFGTGMAGWQLGANGIGFFDGVVIQSLAIEGEPGYDVLVFENDVRKQRDFYNWGVFESGFTHEGWHYFMFAMEGAGPALLAAEIRGQGVLGNTSAKEAMVGAFYQLSPWISGEQVKIFSFADGAGIGSPGRINIFFPIMKRLYPSDPVVDFMYNLQIEHQEDRKLTSDWMIFGLLPNKTDWTSAEVADASGLSLSRFCPDSGRVMMRSDWTEDAMSVHFSARMDTYGLQKMHADINVLALFSHRRQWISDTDLAGTLKFNDEFNDYHSTILIDGLGQSGTSTMKTWPSLPGRVLDFYDNGIVASVVGDATLAYSYYGADYECGKRKQESCADDEGCVWDTGVWGCVKNWSVGERAPFNLSTSYRWGETNEEANMKTFSYAKFFNGSARDLDAESEKWRGELTVCPQTIKGRCWGGYYNPVRFAFRTVIMIRGKENDPKPHPYVVVMDDIQAQDEQQHNYTITWQVRPHQDHWSRSYGARDIKRWEANRYQTLKSTSDSEAVLMENRVDRDEDELDDFPELVVRMVGDPAEGPVRDQFNLLEEDGRHGQSGLISAGYQRLTASRQTALPRFKTIFYPRKQSDPELRTTYNAQTNVLRVTLGDTVDTLHFSTGVDGRSALRKFLRNNEELSLGSV